MNQIKVRRIVLLLAMGWHAFVLMGCRPKVVFHHILHYDDVVAIDTFGCSSKPSLYYHLDRRDTYYPAYYIGEKQDTIYLNRKTVLFDTTRNHRLFRGCIQEYISPGEIEIVVDTVQSLCKEMWYGRRGGLFKRDTMDSIRHFNAFPILITNLSDSVTHIGNADQVDFLMRQYQTPGGEWIPMDSFSMAWRCIGMMDFFLKPNEILLAKFIRFGYGAKAKQRLKFSYFYGTVYSNEFTDYIGDFPLDTTLVKPSWQVR